MITDEMLKTLADIILEEIQRDFEIVYLSGNLRDTIDIERTAEGFRIVVNAKMYDVLQYRQNKTIVYTGQGSYAEEVNKTGGFSGKHVGYIEDAIHSGIRTWMNKYGLKGKMYDR